MSERVKLPAFLCIFACLSGLYATTPVARAQDLGHSAASIFFEADSETVFNLRINGGLPTSFNAARINEIATSQRGVIELELTFPKIKNHEIEALQTNLDYSKHQVQLEKEGFNFHSNQIKDVGRGMLWKVTIPSDSFQETVTQMVGLVQASIKYGAFDHDRLVGELTGLGEETIRLIRNHYENNTLESPTLFRYFMGDPSAVDRNYFNRLFGADVRATPGSVQGYLELGLQGTKPLVLPGESVVWHRLTYHRHSVIGKYNPGLVNGQIHDLLANKYIEYLFWQDYLPGAIAHTELVENLVGPKKIKAQRLKEALDRAFPEGWILKPTWGFGAERTIITDRTNLVKELETFRKSDFKKFRAQKTKEMKGNLEDELYDVLKAHPGYLGSQISELLKLQPQDLIVQKRLSIEREFRVEVIGGKILGGPATVDRYRYEFEEGGRKFGQTYVPPPKEHFTKVEAFAQKLIDHLPENLKVTPFGMDVAWLKDGSLSLIESNPGGNSTFLNEANYGAMRLLGDFLKTYPEKIRSGELNPGMSEREQIEFLRRKFALWNVDPKHLLEGIEIKSNEAVDTTIKTHTIDETKIRQDHPRRCDEILAGL